mmetsp:Transcript_22076/g.50431  ORF Transcript_22076/g.50431 Transcript_22076/m.50431 type:complete len:229 (-) Transcript_22076:69-755(-)
MDCIQEDVKRTTEMRFPEGDENTKTRLTRDLDTPIKNDNTAQLGIVNDFTSEEISRTIQEPKEILTRSSEPEIPSAQRRIARLLEEIGRLESRALSSETAAASSARSFATAQASWDEERESLMASVSRFQRALDTAVRKEAARAVQIELALKKVAQHEKDVQAWKAIANLAEQHSERSVRATQEADAMAKGWEVKNEELKQKNEELERKYKNIQLDIAQGELHQQSEV